MRRRALTEFATPEFVIAFILVCSFVCFLLIRQNEALEGALIGQMGIAVGYYLSETRRRPIYANPDSEDKRN